LKNAVALFNLSYNCLYIFLLLWGYRDHSTSELPQGWDVPWMIESSSLILCWFICKIPCTI